MSKEEMDNLIQKYLDAETSLQEEHALKSAFTRGESRDQHQDIAALIGYFEMQKSKSVPVFSNPSEAAQPRKSGRIINIRWIAAAASIAILVLAFFWINPTAGPVATDTYTDPHLAAENAIKALELLGTEINRGQNIAMDQMKEFDNFNKLLDIFQE